MTAVVDEMAPPGTEVDLPREQRAGAAIARCDVPRDLAAMMQLAEVLAGARTIPRHFQRVEDIVVVMMAAQSLDVPLFWGLQAFHLVEGKLGMEATFMRALLYRAGGKLRILEHTAEVATTQIRPPGEREFCDPVTVRAKEYTHLQSKDVWKKNPRAMLMARNTTTSLRLYAPNVLMGMNYTPDELEETERPSITVSAEVRPARAATASDSEAWWRQEIAAATDLGQVTGLWNRAKDRKLLDEALDGVPLRDLLTRRASEITEAQSAADAAGVDAEDVVDVEVDDEPAFRAEAPPPAQALLSCGCDSEVVFQTGNHRPDCPQFTAPVPAADPRSRR